MFDNYQPPPMTPQERLAVFLIVVMCVMLLLGITGCKTAHGWGIGSP